MLFNFQKLSLSNVFKMPFFYLYFVVLLVHRYTITAVAALPVAQNTVLAQSQETQLRPLKTPMKLFHPKLGNLEHGSLALSSDSLWKEKSEDSRRNEEFLPCEVSNKTYQHRERIPRRDPCEICVCVDSEIYCFWKLCPFFNLTTVTLSPATASETQETLKQSSRDNNVTLRNTTATEKITKEIETTDEKFSKMLKDQRKYNALKKLEATSPKSFDFESAKNQRVPTSTAKPTVCHVMGVIYKYGEVLPRDTGTCLECACSEGGRVSCSPKDCVSQPDLDYLSHNNNLDMFELDTF